MKYFFILFLLFGIHSTFAINCESLENNFYKIDCINLEKINKNYSLSYFIPITNIPNFNLIEKINSQEIPIYSNKKWEEKKKIK